ncbi:putative photosynthetic complex assembly protein PuhE [Fulvimarina sp. 2208YS6-2-32]|uniref:Photosynthetic complex assembly protein PuhE n=1 Tax=Fulvimarina uroteuthidis TaxID=3098149 RepID=A0ABU5I157_9HYPH|nr:putative photosynthetic complex assembly protein PuhE [Fulvimarina sp. 2208YS6-2-32]MDY8108488.1 putative photosynthetic complex assembly protein PuhE [Fulvimarina sp. 2208YS6-2-32]
MTEYVYPALFALGVWWASTVAIIYLDGLPQKTFKYSMIGATIIFGVSLWGLVWSASDTSIAGAYWAFTFGLLAWGWQEMSFYMGYVTGPRKQPCPENCKGWSHFGHAIQTSLWHELAIIYAAILVVAFTWGEPNQIGTWTFMVLWWMHQSAKLNVFFGVRNLNEEFLPEHLEFLKGFLNKRSMNLLFPFSVTISTIITVLLFTWAFADGATPFEKAGYTFLGVLMALAILEHWMLVLPMPTATLWSPGLKSRGDRKPFAVDIVVGFLGSGKTTTLRRMLSEANPAEKTVVLVNDFGELGIDGSLLSGQGADVIELPNGCICCSLRKDLAAQLREVVSKMAPDRVLIEPSGVADVASLLQVLATPEIASLVKATRLYTVIDAGAFLGDYARMPDYFDVQARIAPVFILNKIDLVSESQLGAVRETLVALNPKAKVLPARYGAVEDELSPSQAIYVHPTDNEKLDSGAEHDHGHADGHGHAHGHGHGHGHGGHHGHAHDHSHDPELGMRSWSRPLSKPIPTDDLSEKLHAVARGAAGKVDRMKGIARSGDGWLRFDIAGGRVSMAVHIPGKNETARALAIGKTLDLAVLDRMFDVPAAARSEAVDGESDRSGFGAEPAMAS